MMIKVYIDLIMKGARTIDEVPVKFRNDVKSKLIQMGYPGLSEGEDSLKLD